MKEEPPRKPNLKELLLAPEARTEQLVPPRRQYRRRKRSFFAKPDQTNTEDVV